MIPTENLYLKYLYSTSKTALRDFLDALGREAEHAVAENVPDHRSDRRSASVCDLPVVPVRTEVTNADR